MESYKGVSFQSSIFPCREQPEACQNHQNEFLLRMNYGLWNNYHEFISYIVRNINQEASCISISNVASS